MSHIHIEIKARCEDPGRIREILRKQGAVFCGMDHQVDTYFRVSSGRLKLREGTIENALVYYSRPDQPGPKQADVTLCRLRPDPAMRQVLADALGIRVQVVKQREIYYIDNVKIHLDQVGPLGTFVEIEAIDETGAIGRDRLTEQCRRYMELFGICPDDLIPGSYSDMIESPASATNGSRHP